MNGYIFFALLFEISVVLRINFFKRQPAGRSAWGVTNYNPRYRLKILKPKFFISASVLVVVILFLNSSVASWSCLKTSDYSFLSLGNSFFQLLLC